MAFDPIRIGQPPDGAGGDDARTGFARTNANFEEAQRQLDGKASKDDLAGKLSKDDAKSTYQTKSDASDQLASKMAKNPGGTQAQLVRGDGSIGNTIDTNFQVKHASAPMFEWHAPGWAAWGCFLFTDSSLNWVVTNGGGSGIGSAKARLDSGGNLQILGGFSQGSDHRLKANVVDLNPDEVLANVAKLRLFEYDAILDPKQARTPGAFAHEVAAVFPHLVIGEKDASREVDDGEGGKTIEPVYQRVNYTGLGVYLASAMQALLRKVEKSEQALQALAERLDAMSGATSGGNDGTAG